MRRRGDAEARQRSGEARRRVQIAEEGKGGGVEVQGGRGEARMSEARMSKARIMRDGVEAEAKRCGGEVRRRLDEAEAR